MDKWHFLVVNSTYYIIEKLSLLPQSPKTMGKNNNIIIEISEIINKVYYYRSKMNNMEKNGENPKQKEHILHIQATYKEITKANH